MSFKAGFARCFIGLAFVVFMPFYLPVFAGSIVADPNATGANRPTVDVAPNGVPLVDIATPNASGLSHNQFSDFNIDASGAILNNSNQETGTSVLGGIVGGNSNLQNGTASIILNEVTSTSPSTLSGYLEVFGNSAQVIVANPNGITCNGCGFINTPRATLSTGRPQLNANGSLDSFLVENGTISFGRAGGNFSNIDLFDIISRRVRIDGPVFAKHLRIRAGKNKVDYTSGNATSLGSDEGGIAIDSTAFGGMYADRISIIATEKGAGVNMRGDMAANAGELSISTDGKITISKAYAHTNIRLDSQGEIDAQSLSALGNVIVNSKNSITIHSAASLQEISLESFDDFIEAGSLIATGNIALAASQNIDLGTLVTENSLNITSLSGSVFMQRALVQSNLTVETQAGDIAIEEMVSYQNIHINSARGLNINSLAIASGNITLSGQNIGVHTAFAGVDVTQTLASNGETISWQTPADLTIAASHGDINVQNLFASGLMTLEAEQTIFATALKSAQDLTLSTSSGNLEIYGIDVAGALLANAGQNGIFGSVHAAGRVTVNAGGNVQAASFENQAGAIEVDAQGYILISNFVKSQSDITLTSQSSNISLVQAITSGNLTLSAQGNLTAASLQATGSISAVSSKKLEAILVLSDGNIVLDGSSVEVRERLSSRGSLTVVAQSGDIRSNGLVSSGASVSLTASNSILIFSDDELLPSAIVSGGDITLTTHNGIIQFDQLGATSNINLQGSQGITGGNLISDAGMIVVASENGGLNFEIVSSHQSLEFSGQSITASEISVAGTIGPRSLILNSDGEIDVQAMAAFGPISISGGSLELGAVFGAGDSITLDATNGSASLKNIRSAGTFTLNATRNIDVSQIVASEGDISIVGGGLVSLQQVFTVEDLEAENLSAGGDISITANGNLTSHSTLFGQDINLASTTGAITIDANILASGNLELEAEGNITAFIANPTDDNSILLRSGGALNINSDGSIYFNILASGGDLDIKSKNILYGQTVISDGDIDLGSQNSFVSVNEAQSGGSLFVEGKSLFIGNLFAQGSDITLEATSGAVRIESIRSAGHFSLTASGNIAINQTLAAQGDITISGGTDISLQQVYSVDDLQAENIQAGGAISIAANGHLVSASTIFGQTINLESTTGSLGLNHVRSGQDLILSALSGHVQADGLLSGGNTTIIASGSISFTTLIALENARIRSINGTVEASKKIVTGQSLNIEGQVSVSTPQAITGGDLTITSNGSILVHQAISVGATQFTAENHIGSDIVTALQDVTLAAHGGTIVVDHIITNQNITLTAASTIGGQNANTAIWEALGSISVTADDSISFDKILSAQTIELTSTAGYILGNEVGAGNVITLNAEDTITLYGQIVAGGGIAITSTNGAIISHSNLLTIGSIALNSQESILIDGDLVGLQQVYANSQAGNLSVSNILAGTSITLHAGNLEVSENLSAVESIAIQARGNLDLGQHIVAGDENGYGDIFIDAQSLSNDSNNPLVFEGNAQLKLSGFTNNMQIAALGTLLLQVDGNLTNEGAIFSGGDTAVIVNGTLQNNANGLIQSGHDLTIAGSP